MFLTAIAKAGWLIRAIKLIQLQTATLEENQGHVLAFLAFTRRNQDFTKASLTF
jgi:hypothetical protein